MSDGRLPNANTAISTIIQHLERKVPLLFLDYDGTLVPKLKEPEKAVVSEHMRQTLTLLSAKWPTAVITGRKLADIKAMLGIEALYYAGNHGFEIATYDGQTFNKDVDDEALAEIRQTYDKLCSRLDDYHGVWIEHKNLTLTVHSPYVPTECQTELQTILSECLRDHHRLEMNAGKSIHEIRPAVGWHKGQAVNWLQKHMKPAKCSVIAIYIGDDTTDEDAFATLKAQNNNIRILVGDDNKPTSANYVLDDPVDVYEFLNSLLDSHKNEQGTADDFNQHN